MRHLDDQKKIASLDNTRVYDSVVSFGDQFEQAWKESASLSLSDSYRNVKNIILCGMGGSALGAHVLKALYEEKLSVPFSIVNGYKLPNETNDNTLVILSSYSGETEEILACAEEAMQRQAKIVGIATGGRLAALLREHGYPAYVFEPKHNPSNQPRMGSGYSLGFYVRLFQTLGFLAIEEDEMNRAAAFMKGLSETYGAHIPEASNTAKKIAQDLKDKQVVIAASEFLRGNAHVLANQINENAKQFACFFEIPELNHHLMEGLRFPKANQKNLTFLFLESSLYEHKIQARYPITKEVLEQNGVAHTAWNPKSKGKFLQTFETLVFGSFVSFYLAMLNDIDPSEIPFVKYFKEELQKRHA